MYVYIVNSYLYIFLMDGLLVREQAGGGNEEN